MQPGTEFLELVRLGDRLGPGEAAGLGDADEVDPHPGMARLHAGLAIMVVVQHHDREVFWKNSADGQQPANPHELLAIARDDRHPFPGPGKRQA